MEARVSSALAAAEFHSLSPPCVHSAETPGPFMPQPGAFSRGKSCHEGLSRGSPRSLVANPRMFSASYQRYSWTGFDVPFTPEFCEKTERRQTKRRMTHRISGKALCQFSFIISFIDLIKIRANKF